MLEEIYDYMEKHAPREACGVIVINKGESAWVPCRNDSLKDDEFILNKYDYIQAHLNNEEVVAVVHSHINQEDLKLSEHDRKASNFLKIPYWVIGIPQRECIIHE